MIKKILHLFLSYSLVCSCAKQNSSEKETGYGTSYSGWEMYSGTKDGMRYSSIDQINKENVTQLKEVWRYSSGDKDAENRSQNQCNPIVVNGILYGSSPKLKLFALDAVTGEQQWVFDPAGFMDGEEKDPLAFFKVSRGVAFWQDGDGEQKRIFHNVGERIYCVDAETGKPIPSFGNNGWLDLSRQLGRDPDSLKPFIAATTPGVIYRDMIIVSMRVSESADAAPGHIRAYDVRTGELRWIFHTIPHPGEPGYKTWPDKDAWQKLGGANSWAGMSLDEQRGIVYIPTGSVSGDFYGGIREGKNLFANSLIALEAGSGKYLWHYQIVHHDLWDRDLPANPNLVTLYKENDTVDAVAQITKHGYIFMFDRVTGEPIFPIEEKPVPQNALPGEKPWPTQPIPTLPEPFARQSFTRNDVSDLTPETNRKLLERYDQVRYTEMFTPPSKEGSWIFPGFDGGGQWGGASVDPETQILYINSSELPWSLTMVDVPKEVEESRSYRQIGERTYNKYCMSCHGTDRSGDGTSYPSLVDLGERFDIEHVRQIINNGRNMMPAFRNIPKDQKDALVSYLLNLTEKEQGQLQTISKEPGGNIMDEIPYRMTGYNRFLDENGYPGIKPPWGTLNAVDLKSGRLLWKVPLGEYKELSARGLPPTGTENYGGPVVTKGGLVFIAATKDSKIRAFDKDSGKILWEADLPVPGYATPAVYMAGGKQYVVIACGGGKIGSPSGDDYIAFALPDTVVKN